MDNQCLITLDQLEQMADSILVLDDGSTYGRVEGSHVVFLTENQLEQLDAGMEPDELDGDLVRIEVGELLKAWKQMQELKRTMTKLLSILPDREGKGVCPRGECMHDGIH